MSEIDNILQLLTSKNDLDENQATFTARALASPEVTLYQKKSILIALTDKGETAIEVTAFAKVFRELSRKIDVADFANEAIDVCGTGGDHSGSFNISTTVSFVLAAAGIPVFKHGNRSVTSKCGSADLLSELGFNIQSEPDEIRQSLKELNYCFFFAPLYHPAFKEIVPVRKELAVEGKRTIFNLLGPLINPGEPNFQLLGVYAEDWVAPIATALDHLGLSRGLVVHSKLPNGKGMDEMSCAGKNKIIGFGELVDVNEEVDLSSVGLSECSVQDLLGGSVADNVNFLYEILSGKGNRGLVDSIALNAGAALWIANKANNLQDGVDIAINLIQSGKVNSWLITAQKFYKK